jgi:hypothetical protein
MLLDTDAARTIVIVQEDLSNTIEDIPANIADLMKEISNVEPATDKKW